MEQIKTKSFILAINTVGEIESNKLAIVLPGRLDTKDYWNFGTHLKLLASKGFYAICFDPPGTWESSGGLKLFTTTNYLKAVNELIEYFGNKPTLLIGHSRGGQVAMLASVANLNVVGFVSINGSFEPSMFPSTDKIVDGIFTEYRDLPPGNMKTTERKEFKLPDNFFEDGARYNLLGSLPQYSKPKLIIYSSNDKFIEPKEVEEIYNSLSQPKTLHRLNSVHDYRYSPTIVTEVNQTISKFVDRYMMH